MISNLASPYKAPVEKFGLTPYFDSIQYSCDAGCKKPEDKIYLKPIKEMKVYPSEILMVGDKLPNDVFAPKKLGIQSLLLDRSHKQYLPDKINNLTEIKGFFM